MRVLGIDPGYAIVGWGVLDYAGNRFSVVNFGAVTTQAGVPFEQRLRTVYEGVSGVIAQYRPEALAIEQLFYQHNQTTVIGVAEARGVILLAAAQAGMPDLRVHAHAGQAGRHGLRQGREKAGAGDDAGAAAPGQRAQAGRYRRRAGHGHHLVPHQRHNQLQNYQRRSIGPI
jgi:crossover junction endodeoxyribonuclease RuvC